MGQDSNANGVVHDSAQVQRNTDHLAERLALKNTAVILGMHHGTMGDFDQTRTDCDVFVMNEMLSRGAVARADYVMQLHKPVVWRSTQNRNDRNHYEWLKSNTETPVFMAERFDDVPMSRRFPLEEIKQYFKGAEWYFTTTIAYAIAYAIYAGYKRIELYGIEMETNTEYTHQRPCVAYWCGVAYGKGIEVDFHSPQFFVSPLYGYEGDITIPVEVFEKRAKMLAENAKTAVEEYKQARLVFTNSVEAFRDDYKVGMKSLETYANNCANLAHEFNMNDGALQVNQRHIKSCKIMEAETGTYFLSKQVYENEFNSSVTAWQEHQQSIREISAALKAKDKELEQASSKGYRSRRCDEYLQLVRQYVQVIGKAGLLSGISVESKNLMAIHDQNERMAGGAKAVEIMAEAQA